MTSLSQIYIRIDRLRTVNDNMRNHTGIVISLVNVAKHYRDYNQNLNTKSSTECEIVRVS